MIKFLSNRSTNEGFRCGANEMRKFNQSCFISFLPVHFRSFATHSFDRSRRSSQRRESEGHGCDQGESIEWHCPTRTDGDTRRLHDNCSNRCSANTEDVSSPHGLRCMRHSTTWQRMMHPEEAQHVKLLDQDFVSNSRENNNSVVKDSDNNRDGSFDSILKVRWRQLSRCSTERLPMWLDSVWISIRFKQ